MRRYWSNRAVSLAGIYTTSCPHRFGFVVIDAARLLDCSPLRESKLFQQRQMLRNIAFVSIQAKRRPTHAAWAASMRAESKTRRRLMALSCTTPLLAGTAAALSAAGLRGHK